MTVEEGAAVRNEVSVVSISRGGVTLAHDHFLKAGDVFPIRIKYGDIDIRTNVKVVKATNDIAEAEYMNVAQSTVNKLLYLSLITEGQLNSRGIPATIGNRNAISYEN